MLYPDFKDLLIFRGRKFDKAHLSRRKMGSRAPGSHQSPFRGQGLDFDAVREYVPGDDIRSIDWRVTARTGSPHVKLFKEEKERHTVICVDMNASMRFGTKNTFKSVQAARSASLLGWRALAHHDRLSVCLFGDVPGGLQYFASKHSSLTIGKMLKRVSQPPTEHHHVSLETALQHVNKVAYAGSCIYLISDFMDLPSTLPIQRSCEVILIAINDPADRALTPAGMVGFCGQNGEKAFINTDSSRAREAYAAQWEANRKALHALKLPVVSLSTESEIFRDLLFGLRRIHARAP